jgi:hypothetical protein
MRRVAEDLASRAGIEIEVVPVVNRLFGETVSVSGLLCGGDVLAALQGCDLGDVVMLPRAMFAEPPTSPTMGASRNSTSCPSHDEKGCWREVALRTLDEVTLKEIIERVGRPVVLGDLVSEVWAEIVRPGSSPAGA